MIAAGCLRPFWSYYGSKWRVAPRYPRPVHATIVEPFAGAAGYSLRYPERNVVLVERYSVVAEMWRYLIAVSDLEVRAIPLVSNIDDLPSWVPVGARSLIGFCLNAATTSPRRSLSSGRIKLAAMGRNFEGWTEARRERVAQQVTRIRHWRIIEGDYRDAPRVRATWFVDPPYANDAGRRYIHGPDAIDHRKLSRWCRSRAGQTIVCENEGATWLPFRPMATLKPGPNSAGSREVVWASFVPSAATGRASD